MGLFNKKESKSSTTALPNLPDLPMLPNLPEIELDDVIENKSLPQLPSFPKTQAAEIFSQKAIKEAVSGEKEERGVSGTNIQKPLHKEATPEMLQHIKDKPFPIPEKNYQIPKEFVSMPKKSREAEPVFIRIDKFQESLELFAKARQKISDIEILMRDIKSIKEKEEEEFNAWEQEIQAIKIQIEKIDKDIFSKIE